MSLLEFLTTSAALLILCYTRQQKQCQLLATSADSSSPSSRGKGQRHHLRPDSTLRIEPFLKAVKTVYIVERCSSSSTSLKAAGPHRLHPLSASSATKITSQLGGGQSICQDGGPFGEAYHYQEENQEVQAYAT
jgi:hypothetical protein